jgi:hypothetical protein
MCGRYRRTTSEEELARLYHIPIPPQRDLPISCRRSSPEVGRGEMEGTARGPAEGIL